MDISAVSVLNWGAAHWGDLCSAAGLGVSLVGFTLGLIALSRANRHFDEAISTVTSIDTQSLIAAASSTLDRAVTSCEQQEWLALQGECKQLREQLAKLGMPESGLQDKLISELRSIQANIKNVHEALQSFSVNDSSSKPAGYKKMASLLSDQQDAMTQLSTSFKTMVITKNRRKNGRK